MHFIITVNVLITARTRVLEGNVFSRVCSLGQGAHGKFCSPPRFMQTCSLVDLVAPQTVQMCPLYTLHILASA